MIIQCKSCDKKFNVPDAAIVAGGRLVQCSSCGNQWTQYPIKTKSVTSKPASIPSKVAVIKKKVVKKKGPIPYSKEYMQQKWGTSVKSYAAKKGLTKNTIKQRKQKNIKSIEKPGFGFFNYIITYSVLFTFLIGILKFERARISRKFPILEPYIDHFFESLEIFKIFILDFFR
tara:strand:- start:8282 stop:8800 length:519 start_codon:yes stop_codon:yes gene_type:complete